MQEAYRFVKTEHTVSPEALLMEMMVANGLTNTKDAVNALLADPNNSYSKNELKSAALNMKKILNP